MAEHPVENHFTCKQQNIYSIGEYGKQASDDTDHDNKDESESCLWRLFVEATVFYIFKVERKDDPNIITQPLTNITTNEYCIDFQIAYSSAQEKVLLTDSNEW